MRIDEQRRQYDTEAKFLLSDKRILAVILQNVVEEFKDLKIDEIVDLIEGTPELNVPLEAGETNPYLLKRIHGMNTEDSVPSEGKTVFDILFFVRTKAGLTKMIVNVEAQKDFPAKYPIVKRGIFYSSREVSSQLERDFFHGDYDSICKTYSIWLCMNRDQNELFHIHLTKEDVLGTMEWKPDYELINVVIINLAKHLVDAGEDRQYLHRFLCTLFNTEVGSRQRKEILEKEYDMDMSEEMESRVNNMCNLGEGIYEQGIDKGRLQMLADFLSKFSAEEIMNLGIQVSAEELREAEELRKAKE